MKTIKVCPVKPTEVGYTFVIVAAISILCIVLSKVAFPVIDWNVVLMRLLQCVTFVMIAAVGWLMGTDSDDPTKKISERVLMLLLVVGVMYGCALLIKGFNSELVFDDPTVLLCFALGNIAFFAGYIGRWAKECIRIVDSK